MDHSNTVHLFPYLYNFLTLMFVGAGTTFLMSASDRTLTFSCVARLGERTAESWGWTDEKLFPAKVGIFHPLMRYRFSLFVPEGGVQTI